MVLSALRGAVGFLTQIPVGQNQQAFDAFCARVGVVPLVGYLVGALVGLALVVPGPAPTVALLYVLAVVAVTGINHADGLADLGDAAVVHGDPEKRRSVMRDTTVGVGAVVAVAVGVAGLALAALVLATMPVRAALGIVMAGEVGAKLGIVTLAATGRPSHDGLGSRLLGAGTGQLVLGIALAVPATVLTWPVPAATAAVVAGPLVALGLRQWAHATLDGVGGDVFGATNELARIAGLHAGVVVWTLY
ncbi:adenosylcobinamide-GDP ribazoletransferase [Salinibaculum rarum]|uniref:adenosylcobinamide-GDP ribazoletransferase n=1 Tax=Salinibaculum rarum TaxID=3058903 RepID=UPI00265F24D2|nr:adenosylcobinamide-GDP ribazoletransferase [Salinibaculum sp. KK48]